MDEKTKIEYWLELADYDIEVAQSLLNSKKYLYVGFFSHLIIEKTLKAYFWYKNRAEPPYSHNLMLLADKTGLLEIISEDNKLLLNKLMPLNIEGSNPSDKQLLNQQLTESRVSEILKQTIEMQKWIKELLIF